MIFDITLVVSLRQSLVYVRVLLELQQSVVAFFIECRVESLAYYRLLFIRFYQRLRMNWKLQFKAFG